MEMYMEKEGGEASESEEEKKNRRKLYEVRMRMATEEFCVSGRIGKRPQTDANALPSSGSRAAKQQKANRDCVSVCVFDPCRTCGYF